jgi:xanthine dehydrogenase accessory factor
MDRRESERLLRAVREARAAGEPAALATVVRVRGSAYRREGTQMFVRRDSTYECALSGGCLEPAVADAAARVIATGTPVVVSYDLADDSIWGLGIGCSGAVDIHIERLSDDEVTNEWLRILEAGEAGVQVTPLAGAAGRLVVGPNGALGSLGNRAIDDEAIASARARLRTDNSQSSAERIDGADLFFLVASRPPQLAIFGAGHDAEPMARLAWTLGFEVTVIDARESFLSRERFPGATLVVAHFSRFADTVRLGPEAFALVMNHHVERDRETLRFCLDSEARCIGVLGPRPRYEKLMAALAADGFLPEPAALARVRSPVGLALGAETPDEVAVSVLAEIVALCRGFDGGFLNGSVGSLHRLEEKSVFARS